MTLEELIKLNPEAGLCAFCGKRNDHWDDSGFFYLSTRPGMALEEGEAACKACTEGEPGALHEALHGTGNGNR
jgi:hypothetical protein